MLNLYLSDIFRHDDVYARIAISFVNKKKLGKISSDFVNVYFTNLCLKSVPFWNISSAYFPIFGLNTERYFVSLPIWSEYEKIRTRKTPNTGTFHTVNPFFSVYIYPTDLLTFIIFSKIWKKE